MKCPKCEYLKTDEKKIKCFVVKSKINIIKLDDLLDIIDCDYIVKDILGDVIADTDVVNVGNELVNSISWNKLQGYLEIRIDKDLTEEYCDEK